MVAALATSLIFAALAPGAAVAKKGYLVFAPSHTMEAHSRGSHGFGISLQVDAEHVSLSASNDESTTEYTAREASGGETIRARFGSLGKVSLRFHPHGKARSDRFFPTCRGGGSFIQPGTFVGRLDFEGEQGYTVIHVTRIKGREIGTKKQICKRPEAEDDGRNVPSFRWTFLQAISKKNGLSFDAFKTEFKSKPAFNATSFSAMMLESPGQGMSILRSIQATGDFDAFSTSKSHGRVDTATVTPSAPFSGSATYQRAPTSDSETWTGSLAGEFPGLGTIPLTGPEFCADSELFKSCGGSAAWIVTLAS